MAAFGPPRHARPCVASGCANPVGPAGGRDMCPKHRIRVKLHGDASVVAYRYGADNPATHRRGHLHPRWVGDEATYAVTHERISRERGRAAEHECVSCSEPAAHWSYDHLDERERTEVRRGVSLTYSTDPSHYRPMCVRCHKRDDLDYAGEVAYGRRA